jgi:hypothetical protein
MVSAAMRWYGEQYTQDAILTLDALPGSSADLAVLGRVQRRRPA